MNNSESVPQCPVCGQNDQVVKVSRMYLLARENKQSAHPFAPPEGKRQQTRPIHPDMVVGALTLVVVVFLYNIIRSQPNMILPVVIVLAIFYLAYFLGRKWILGRYQAEQSQENAHKGNIEAAIGEWMKLYYCARDKGVFDPSENELIPIDQMRTYLFRQL